MQQQVFQAQTHCFCVNRRLNCENSAQNAPAVILRTKIDWKTLLEMSTTDPGSEHDDGEELGDDDALD